MLIQAPVYNIFYNSILNNGRVVLSSDLVYEDGKYYMDALATTPTKTGIRYCAIADLEVGSQKNIPLWLFGFLY